MNRPEVLAHRIDGTGETVLLLNGGMMTIASWDAIAAPLSEHYRVLRCDFRGQLRSPGTPHRDLAGHVADLVALLDELQIERVHAVGTSFGAEVGLLLAAFHPDRVASLVAATATDIATPLLQDGSAELRRELRGAAAGRTRDRLLVILQDLFYSPTYVAAHRRELSERAAQVALLPNWWFAGAADLLSALENLDLRRYLGGITCPVLVLAAGEDRVMPLERAQALATAIPAARLEVVEGSGHALVVEQPERFVEICLEFLAGVQRYE
ncbi:MAG TPA: alpha/beta hydrolase [Thermoanaerobaculaceae bacterium]|nr:alpha/beta hydrolase [Thermoanaerobaculaceae bacterium]